MLKLEKTGVPISLSVLQRLLAIDPIREDEWKAHAAEQLLPEDPGMVSAWLLANGGADSVIKHLRPDLENADEPSAVSLVEAYLIEGQPEEAKQVLLQAADRINPATYAYLGSRVFHALGDSEIAYEKWEESHNAAMASDAYPIVKNLENTKIVLLLALSHVGGKSVFTTGSSLYSRVIRTHRSISSSCIN